MNVIIYLRGLEGKKKKKEKKAAAAHLCPPDQKCSEDKGL